MRQVAPHEYETARRALETYKAYSAPYVQRNGWTVIPADAPRPLFDGAPLTTDAINAFSTNVELFELERDMPAKFSAYAVIDNGRAHVTTWTGELIGRVTHEGRWHRNNLGARWRQLTIRVDWNQAYTGREYDSRQLVNFRRIKS